MKPLTFALDVGGVLYYDEPFELAWLQGVLDRLEAADPAINMEEFVRRMSDFYRPRRAGSPPPSFFPPNGTHSWRDVRKRWLSLVQPVPDALEALAQLADGHEVCVVANQPPECRAALSVLGAERHLRLVAVDSLVGHAKPDPRIFQWAFGQLGWEPGHTVVIGDRPDHDAVPALELGCSAAVVAVDDGWTAPESVAPELVTAYRALRRQRQAPRGEPSGYWTLSGLGDLVRLLPSLRGGIA